MNRKLNRLYILLGLACYAYYLLFSITTRFGLNMDWMWLTAGTALTAAGLVGRRRVPRWLRIAWRSALCIGAALILALEALVISGMTQTPPAGLDYLIVLGARVNGDGPSRALQWRIDAAAEYMLENPETVAIASGGQGADEPMSEAECIRRGLIAAGIAEDRILLEDKSTTTAENMAFSRGMIPDAEARVGVVTNNYHVYRAVRLAEKAGFERPSGVAAHYGGFSLLHYMVREGACLIADSLLGNL